MKPERLLLPIFCLLILVVFSACILPNGGEDCEFGDDDLPVLNSPDDIMVSDLRPTLEWSWGDCLPDELIVEVVQLPEQPGDLSNLSIVADTVVSGTETSWTLDADLDPATLYLWRVKPNNGMDIQVDYERYQWLIFWTGPACTLDQLWVPGLISPEPAEVVQEPFVYLFWEWPDASCLPDGYFYDVSTTHDFQASYRGGPIHPLPGLRYPIEVEDCQVYYWRVFAFTEDTGGNDVSSYFFTDFTGACQNFSCDESLLVAPTLLSPVDGEAVSEFGSEMLYSWEYTDPDCQPDGYLIEAYSGNDFDSTPLGSRFTLDTRTVYGPIPEVPNYIEFPDCTEFKWRVAALDGDATGPFSDVATFRTDYSGTCAIQSDLTAPTFAGIACLENNRMMASFRFLSTPLGSYEAMLGQETYECSTLDQSPTNLYCFGRRVAQDTELRLRLIDNSTRDMLFDESVLIPVCTPPSDRPSSDCYQPKPDSDPCWIWFGEPTCQWICFN